jgi:hypothetical protein
MKYWYPHLPFGQHISVSTLVNNNKKKLGYLFVSCCSLFFSFIAVRCPSKDWLFTTDQLMQTICGLVIFNRLCDKVCQWLATGRWFSLGPPISSTNKTDYQDITEILLKVALNTIKQTKSKYHGHTYPYLDLHLQMQSMSITSKLHQYCNG